jgi:hypothetical protein
LLITRRRKDRPAYFFEFDRTFVHLVDGTYERRKWHCQVRIAETGYRKISSRNFTDPYRLRTEKSSGLFLFSCVPDWIASSDQYAQAVALIRFQNEH